MTGVQIHTPGPWEKGDFGQVIARDEHGNRVVIADVYNGAYADGRANQVLVVTAPKLLVACMELVLSQIDEDENYSDEHLLFTCKSCGAFAEDEHVDIVHEDDCLVGKADQVIKEALGLEEPS